MARYFFSAITCYMSLVLAGDGVVNRSDQEQLNDNQSLFKIMDEAGARYLLRIRPGVTLAQ